MPNKYTYRRMTPAETIDASRAAGLTVSDMCKLFGRHYSEIKGYLDPDGNRSPTVCEMLMLEFLAEYPEHTPVVLDMAEVRITGQRKPGGADAA